MRISDWSSDVCSSDLDHPQHLRDTLAALLGYAVVGRDGATADGSPQVADRIEAVGCILIKDHHSHEASAVGRRQVCQVDVTILNREATVLVVYYGEIGRASCRERVCKYV